MGMPPPATGNMLAAIMSTVMHRRTLTYCSADMDKPRPESTEGLMPLASEAGASHPLREVDRFHVQWCLQVKNGRLFDPPASCPEAPHAASLLHPPSRSIAVVGETRATRMRLD